MSNNQQLLLQILQSQRDAVIAQTETKVSVDNLTRRLDETHIRLFGGEGIKGSLVYLHEQDEALEKKIEKVKDNEVKDLSDKVTALEKSSILTSWKLGTVSAGAGAALSFGIGYLKTKLFH